MSSVQHLREFIRERETAAAAEEEIFTEFERTIVQYEEELDRQRPLTLCWKPQIMLLRLDLQQHVYEEEEVPVEQQLWELWEAPQIKEEQEALCRSQEAEQLVLKQEPETFMGTPTFQESDFCDAEPNTEQLFSHNTLVAQSRDQEGNSCPVSKSLSDTDRNTGSVKCDICGKNISIKYGLRRHHRVHTGERPHACKTCGRRFTETSGLIKHMVTHTGEKQFSCETCGKRFSRGNNLKVHMRTHTGVKPYPCEICGRSFSQKSSLRCHMETHKGEKTHSCKTCGEKFRNSDGLLKHMKTHTGYKFSCETCGKGFGVSHALKVHMRIHTGERPFSCELCEKTFRTRNGISAHMSCHYGVKPYSCLTCGKNFSRRIYLNIHMQTHNCL